MSIRPAKLTVGMSGNIEGVVIIADHDSAEQSIWSLSPKAADKMAERLTHYARLARSMSVETCQRRPA